MLRYALYTRKSDERREVTEKSTGEQLAACRALAPGLGVIVREFEESKSAKRPGVRPLFDEMLRLVEKGEINAILCWKVDRLARNMKEGGALSQLLIDGHLREIRTPHACHKPGDNILPLVLETATSTQYSLDLKVNVVRGLNGHFDRGGWNACAPQGYRNDRDLINPKVGIVVADEPRFTLLRKGWDMMLTGAYSPGEVARTLSDVYGYRTRKTLERGGTKLSRSYAYKLFTNPFYAGYTWYKGDVRPGVHPAMVTEAEFGRVQELLKASMVPHAKTHEFAYTGLMRCGACGAMVTAELHLIKAAGGTRKPYRFYRCADSHGECTKRGLSEQKVEEAIEAGAVRPERRAGAVPDRRGEPGARSGTPVGGGGRGLRAAERGAGGRGTAARSPAVHVAAGFTDGRGPLPEGGGEAGEGEAGPAAEGGRVPGRTGPDAGERGGGLSATLAAREPASWWATPGAGARSPRSWPTSTCSSDGRSVWRSR